MGNASRGIRTSYAQARYASPNGDLGTYGSTGLRRVFISFHMEDEDKVNLLRSQAKDERFDLEFIDYSVHEPFDESWKARCADRIAQTSVVVVMIGEDTHTRPAVNWEIAEAYRQGKKVVGVRIYRDANHTIPAEMAANNATIVSWNMQEIDSAIYGEA